MPCRVFDYAKCKSCGLCIDALQPIDPAAREEGQRLAAERKAAKPSDA